MVTSESAATEAPISLHSQTRPAAGDKLGSFREATAAGYTVVLCFIGISGADVSEQRVAIRVTQGGHDVPTEKLERATRARWRTSRLALLEIPCAWIFDNDNLRTLYRLAAVYEHGRLVDLHKPIPRWLIIPNRR
jgi:predicted ABC-type ATPase